MRYCHSFPDAFALLLLHFIRLYINITTFHFTEAASKWCTVFKYYLFIVSICCYCCSMCSLSNNCYNSLHQYVCITVVTETQLQHCGLEFDLMYTSLGILVGCGIYAVVDFLRSSKVLFEAIFTMSSAILFPTRSPAASAIF